MANVTHLACEEGEPALEGICADGSAILCSLVSLYLRSSPWRCLRKDIGYCARGNLIAGGLLVSNEPLKVRQEEGGGGKV